MAGQDAVPRGVEDEPRGPRPESAAMPQGSAVTEVSIVPQGSAMPQPVSPAGPASPPGPPSFVGPAGISPGAPGPRPAGYANARRALPSGRPAILPPGTTSIPPLGGGSAFGPGGAGWQAPGWREAATHPAGALRSESVRSPGGLGGRLTERLPRGQTGRLITVGIASALVGALLGGGVVAATGLIWDEAHAGASREAGGDQDGLFPRGGNLPGGEDGRLPQWCRRTETGIVCRPNG
ncbi:hypothetical protein [Microbispora sp. H10949]|uniref:hypothetical protein n=1 Tax=Microbispora sp. H10949 TaxID=2729111 RepID=UPI0016044774|nr:hypothetical protein [Microbispora sp. H10949]